MYVTCEKLNHDGDGIVRVNGKVTFVPNLLVGEEALIEITKEHKNYNEGKVIEYLSKSSKRVEVPCKYYNMCGGCNIMHMSYNDQLLFKKEKVKNILLKYARVDINLDIVSSNKCLNYRNKVTLHNLNNKVGYMKKNSNEVINIDECLLLDNRINDEIKNIKDKSSKDYVMRSNGIDVISNDVNNYLIMNVNYFKFRIDINSFFQVNSYICSELFKEIEKNIEENTNVLDLYSGVGTLSIVASRKAKIVTAIEVNKYSYMNALENSKLNNVNNVKFMCGKVEDLIKSVNEKIDTIITDPPRSGMDKFTIDVIKEYLPKKIIYISCDPITLARDINLLSDYYDVKSVKLFDMFPCTSHVESECILELK